MLDIALIKIPVGDLARSVAFYNAALGLKAEFVVEDYGWAQLGGAGFPLALYVPGKGGGDRQPGGSVDFHLVHPDLEALLNGMRQLVDTATIHDNADGSRSLEFHDPDGNVIKIMQG